MVGYNTKGSDDGMEAFSLDLALYSNKDKLVASGHVVIGEHVKPTDEFREPMKSMDTPNPLTLIWFTEKTAKGEWPTIDISWNKEKEA
jgi:hypothetical protein